MWLISWLVDPLCLRGETVSEGSLQRTTQLGFTSVVVTILHHIFTISNTEPLTYQDLVDAKRYISTSILNQTATMRPQRTQYVVEYLIQEMRNK